MVLYRPASGREFYDDQYEDDGSQDLNDRIVFSQNKVYGRKKELQTLTDLFDQLYNNNNNNNQDDNNSNDNNESQLSPVAFIQASAGSGKSAMVRRFIDNQEKRPAKEKDLNYTVCYMQGRFERTCTDPFSAILDALDDFFGRLFSKNQEKNLMRIRTAINESLETETSSLTALIPMLGDVLRGGNGERKKSSLFLGGRNSITASAIVSNNNDSDNNVGVEGPNTWNRIRYLFNVLFCAICTMEYPLIMFLDDCQWADDESLGLIELLLQEPCCRFFMFIGNATRGIVKAEEKTKFSKLMKDIEGPCRKVTRINLLNLSIDEIGEFIADTLHLGIEECRPLTEIIYGKTRGNIFFSMQALEELQRRNILYFSMVLFRWEWNLAGVEFQNALSDLSDNVGEYVSSKIQSLPRKLKRALVIASHTKATFDVETLEALMNEDGIDIDFKELNGLLDMAVLIGLLLNTVGTDLYRFSHDRIQQAAYWMVSSGQERGKLRILIGRKLYELYFQPEGKEWMLFAAADHLNSCVGHGGKDYLSLAELNLMCGRKARFLASFVPASLYLRLALSYLRKLDKDPWKSHYELSYDIYREITDSELCLGKFESGNELAQTLLKKTRNLEDKLTTFLALAEAKGRQQHHAESLLLCKKALVSVGAIPKRMHYLHMKKDVSVIKRFFKKYSDYDILLLPICQDKKNEIVMDLLSQATRRAHLCGNKTDFQFCMARKLRMSLEHGFTRGSAHAFASYGQFLQDSGNDIESALRMARLSRQILAKSDPISNPMKSQTLFVVAYWLEAWSSPREHVMETLQEAHTAGMAKGNMEVGFQCIVICNIFAQSAGYPLEPIEKAGAELIQQLRLYHVNSILALLMEGRLPLLCLMGKKEIDWKELELSNEVQIGESDMWTFVFAVISRLEIGVLFGNLEFAARMSELIQTYAEFGRSYTYGSKEYFYSALAYVGLARKTGITNYQTKAIEFLKKLRYLCRTRGLNVLHKCLLMEAEVLSLECRDMQKLTDAYDEAIIAAVKMGYSQDAAFGSELAGASMLAINEDSLADQYLGQASNLWREYGAYAKVRHISMQRNLTLDEEAETSIPLGPNMVSSKDLDESRASLHLDLLVGIHMKTDIRMEAESLKDDINEKSEGKLFSTRSANDTDLTVINECKTTSGTTSSAPSSNSSARLG